MLGKFDKVSGSLGLPKIFNDFSRVVSPQMDLAGAVTGPFAYRPVSSVAAVNLIL